ncbi:hypothetical protein AAID95_08260 [Campylobacter coli]|nr:hypothetical protein [Campylobacter coli]EAI6907178.1 hypothetical protein [Campylobacter coli]MPA80697.1 hypothetical protein [Campylobacter coli]
MKNIFGFISDWKFYFYFCIPFVCLVLSILFYKIKSSIDLKLLEVKNLESQEFNFIVPFSIYFVPFITSNFKDFNDWLVLILVVILNGVLIIKTNLQYFNPIMLVFNLKIYKCVIDKKEAFILSKSFLTEGNRRYKCNAITSNLYIIYEKTI